MGVCNCSMFCCTLLYVHSIFAIILMGKRELVALLRLSSWCLVIVVWLFLAVRERSVSVVECLTRPRGCGFETQWRHCAVVLEKDTFILA